MSLAIWNQVVLPASRHKWTHPTLTPARQAGTRFTYPGGMEGWVDLGPLKVQGATDQSATTQRIHSSKEYNNKTLQYDAQMNTLSLICTQWRRANYNWWPMTEYTMISTACFNSILSISNTVGINCKHCFGFRQTRRIIDLTDASFTTTLPQVQPAKQFNK